MKIKKSKSGEYLCSECKEDLALRLIKIYPVVKPGKIEFYMVEGEADLVRFGKSGLHDSAKMLQKPDYSDWVREIGDYHVEEWSSPIPADRKNRVYKSHALARKAASGFHPEYSLVCDQCAAEYEFGWNIVNPALFCPVDMPKFSPDRYFPQEDRYYGKWEDRGWTKTWCLGKN